MPATTAFGLDLRTDRPLPFLEPGAGTPSGGRELRISLAAAEEPPWPATAELISDERHRDGGVSFQIESSSEAGYRIHGPLYGRNVLSGDGRRLWGAPGEGGMAAWQRLLVAQVLPFAAVLQGLEVLHASAVTVGGGAIALAGPSGSGKTSLGLALRRQGAGLLADDVLAVERVGEELLAHPGAPVAALDRAEAERLADGTETPPAEVLAANERELVTRAALAPGPLPLRALFFLERRPDSSAPPRFEPVPDPRALLAATFNLLLASPERLAGLLDISALLARGRVEKAVYGAGTDASELAGLLRARLGESR